MTDPTGRSFLSYRRSRLDEARLLLAAQREVGIPTWHDLENLGQAGPTEEQLRQALADPQTANALLWLTPEVADSPMIRGVEIPAIVRRLDPGDAFFLVACAAGGLDYETAANLVQDCFSPHDLSAHNQCRMDADPIGAEEARRVAECVLRNRLKAIHRHLPAGEPLDLRLSTWHKPGFRPGLALDLDWSHRFDPNREAKRGAWDVLLPALATVRATIREEASDRRVEASGHLTLSAAMALGTAFPDRNPVQLAWKQVMPGDGGVQLWSRTATREPSGFEVKPYPGRRDAKDLAILVSARDQVETAFADSKASLPPFAATRVVRPPVTPTFRRCEIATPGQAVDVVETTIDAVRGARRDYPGCRFHLFLSGPAGLAVLLGQQLNTLGRVQLYEHIENEGVYRPSVELGS